MILSSITLDELIAILDEHAIEHEIDSDDEGKEPLIRCIFSDRRFIVAPDGQGPFYESFTLHTLMSSDLDPEVLCNDFNNSYTFCSAVPITINDEDCDESAFNAVQLRARVTLYGGVTRTHLVLLIEMWNAVMCIAEKFFNGAQEDEEVDDNA